MALPEKYAGEQVQCPECRAMLRIPSREEDRELIRWFCRCGQRLKARIRSAGRKIKCPNCGGNITVPFVTDNDSFLEEQFLRHDQSGVVQLTPSAQDEEPSLQRDRKAAAHSPAETPVAAELAPQAEPLSVEPPAEEPTDDDEILELAPLPGETLGAPAAASDDEPLSLADFEVPAEELQATEEEGEIYQVDATQPALGSRPSDAPAPSALPLAQPIDVRQTHYEEEEGIQAAQLSRYFNAGSGSEAARSGVTQVLHGYWLYIPYALLAGCLTNLFFVLRMRAQGQLGASIMLFFLPLVCSLYLYAAFIGCVKDGAFERNIGIERLLHNGLKYFLRFAGTFLLMIPVTIGLAFVAVMAVGASWGMAAGWPLKLLIVVTTMIAGIFFLVWISIPPIVAVLEETNPFFAIWRGLVFGLKHVSDILGLTFVSMLFGGGLIFIIWFFWWISRLLLSIMLRQWPWIFDSLEVFFGGLIGAAIMGQIVASIMVLYLSNLDEERLQEIRSKLRGPQAVPWRLYLTIGAATLALFLLARYRYNALGSLRSMDWSFGSRTVHSTSADA